MNDDTINNRTIVLAVYNDGMIETHPAITNGAMLQIAEQIRQMVLSAPLPRAQNGKHPAPPQAAPIEA